MHPGGRVRRAGAFEKSGSSVCLNLRGSGSKVFPLFHPVIAQCILTQWNAGCAGYTAHGPSGPTGDPELRIAYSMDIQTEIPYSQFAAARTYGGASTPAARTSSSATTTSTGSLAFEPHFSPIQLAALWGYSPPFIRETFRDEPGVIKVDRPEKMHKRSYCSMRIPKSVAHRVHCRLQPK